METGGVSKEEGYSCEINLHLSRLWQDHSSGLEQPKGLSDSGVPQGVEENEEPEGEGQWTGLTFGRHLSWS